MTTASFIQVDGSTVDVHLHPRHPNQDRISVTFNDGPTGNPHRLVLDPETARLLAGLLASAIASPRVVAAADQVIAAQRYSGGNKADGD